MRLSEVEFEGKSFKLNRVKKMVKETNDFADTFIANFALKKCIFLSFSEANSI
jgi:hypothetical protein